MNNYSYSNVNYCYHNNIYKQGDQKSIERFCGNPNNNFFKVVEWEVWQVEFAWVKPEVFGLWSRMVQKCSINRLILPLFYFTLILTHWRTEFIQWLRFYKLIGDNTMPHSIVKPCKAVTLNFLFDSLFAVFYRLNFPLKIVSKVKK